MAPWAVCTSTDTHKGIPIRNEFLALVTILCSCDGREKEEQVKH